LRRSCGGSSVRRVTMLEVLLAAKPRGAMLAPHGAVKDRGCERRLWSSDPSADRPAHATYSLRIPGSGALRVRPVNRRRSVRVPYMDSAGLGAMLGVLASCQWQDRGFAVSGLSERIRTLFQVTHVDGLIPVFSTAEDAGGAWQSRLVHSFVTVELCAKSPTAWSSRALRPRPGKNLEC
jgi:hypothetical protein